MRWKAKSFQGVGGFLIVNDRKNPALAYQTQDNTVESGSDHILTFFTFLQDGGKVFVWSMLIRFSLREALERASLNSTSRYKDGKWCWTVKAVSYLPVQD